MSYHITDVSCLALQQARARVCICCTCMASNAQAVWSVSSETEIFLLHHVIVGMGEMRVCRKVMILYRGHCIISLYQESCKISG